MIPAMAIDVAPAEIPAADYVAGAIAAEMPASYEEDALIAQGMAAYTNAHYLAALRRADPPEELNGADFSADPSKRLGYVTDDTMKAMWGDHYKAYREKITKAAEKAMRYLITYPPIATGIKKPPGTAALSPSPPPNCAKS